MVFHILKLVNNVEVKTTRLSIFILKLWLSINDLHIPNTYLFPTHNTFHYLLNCIHFVYIIQNNSFTIIFGSQELIINLINHGIVRPAWTLATLACPHRRRLHSFVHIFMIVGLIENKRMLKRHNIKKNNIML